MGCFLCQANCPYGPIKVDKGSRRRMSMKASASTAIQCSQACPVERIHLTPDRKNPSLEKDDLRPDGRKQGD